MVIGVVCRLRLWLEAQFEDSISFCIPGEAKYGQSLGKCLLKLAAVLQLNV
jgi:hypothetical protein